MLNVKCQKSLGYNTSEFQKGRAHEILLYNYMIIDKDKRRYREKYLRLM